MPGDDLPFPDTDWNPGMYGPEYSARLTNDVDVVAVGRDRRELDAAVVVLRPVRLVDPRAPRWTACRYAFVASGTVSATSLTLSPFVAAHLRTSLSARRPLVSTRRMSPCSRTYDARSRTPVSGPAYAVLVNPYAFS